MKLNKMSVVHKSLGFFITFPKNQIHKKINGWKFSLNIGKFKYLFCGMG